jgi:hypothetical protein
MSRERCRRLPRRPDPRTPVARPGGDDSLGAGHAWHRADTGALLAGALRRDRRLRGRPQAADGVPDREPPRRLRARQPDHRGADLLLRARRAPRTALPRLRPRLQAADAPAGGFAPLPARTSCPDRRSSLVCGGDFCASHLVPRTSLPAAIEQVAARDPVLAHLVSLVGPITHRPRDPDGPFGALVRAIVYQQLAGRAA